MKKTLAKPFQLSIIRHTTNAVARLHSYSRLVQLVEHRTVNPYVSGSSPESGATF